MIVSELIEILKKMPQDAVVLYRAYSDYQELESNELQLLKAEDKKIIWREANGYSDFRPSWIPKGEEAKYQDFRTVVCFPGN